MSEIPEEKKSEMQKRIEASERVGKPKRARNLAAPLAWCTHARKARCCGNKIECHRRAAKGLIRVVSRRHCMKACPDRAALDLQIDPAVTEIVGEPGEMKIAAVVTAHNEGDEVRKTVVDLINSEPLGTLQVVLVDDGSTDGSCDIARDMKHVMLVRHDKAQGVGRSRNAGYAAAKELGADVVSFHDAHMRFPAGGLSTLGRRAEEEGTFVCAASCGLTKGSNRLWCCDLFWNRDDGLQPKWLHVGGKQQPAEEWTRSPAPMGAGYVVSMKTAARLEEATGNLWDDVVGRWGFSEQAMAVKCYLLDIPVEFSRDVIIRHLYRKANPLPGAGMATARNCCYSMALLLGPEVYRRRFGPWCVKKLGEQVEKVLTAKAWAALPEGLNGGDAWGVFQQICGKRATVAAEHPDHAWLRALARAQSDIAVARGKEAGRMRILQWRPGESTMMARFQFPDAEIHAIELPGHRTSNWYDIAKGMDVLLHTIPLEPRYWQAPEIVDALDGKKGFDLILVGGEEQDACEKVARKYLRPGGSIIRNPSADRNLICDEFARKERKQLKQFAQVPASVAAKAGTKARPKGKPIVTVCLLNYRREQNIGAMLDCLARQTLPLQVYIWNNGEPLKYQTGGGAPCPIEMHPLVARHVQSTANLGCMPRWWMASTADTEYVCSMDDDLLFKDERVLEDAVKASKEGCPDGAVGFFGWCDVEGKGYQGARHINGSREDRHVDVIKGRFMLFRRALLDRVPLRPPIPEADEVLFRCDDIYLNLCLSGGEPGFHLVPGILGKRWKELGQGGQSLACQRGHYKKRGAAVRAVREWLQSRQPAEAVA